MPFILKNLVYDLRTYGPSTAWWNLRFLSMTSLTRIILGNAPMDFHVHGDDCEHDE